jgi:predicted transcriptional regulator
MTITLAPEAETALRETAQRTGQEPDTIVSRLVLETLPQMEQEFMAEVATIQEVLDAIDQGRVRPFKEFMAEHRWKYPGFVSC